MTGHPGPDGRADSATPSPDDRELLAAHVAGDAEAFGVLFRRHRDRLWAVALRTTGDPEEAADALQEALISAFRRAGSYRGDAAVTTWLHRVVVNACLDRLRRRAVRMADPLPEDLDDRPAGVPGAPAPVPDPADLAVDAEQRSAVLAALATLPLHQRAALVLVDMEGFSVVEAAAVLDCAPGTVKSRCSRGRAALLPLLAGLSGPADPPGPAGPAGNRPVGGRVGPEQPATAPPGPDRPRGGDPS
jgi:RNA polymerase sigma-70 factor (ECF subfamily)